MDFICFDGETKNNKYVLFGNNNCYIKNKKGLSSIECFTWLWNELQTKDKPVIFRIEFDINFWVIDFPNQKKIDLFNCKIVQWENFTLRYFRHKFLELRRDGKKKIIYDVYSFFNKSFLKVIKLLDIDLTILEKEVLELGKKDRENNFKLMNEKEIILFNKNECIITSKICDTIYVLMKKSYFFNQYHKEKDFYTTSFYGASAIANKFLNNFDLQASNFTMMFTDDKIKKVIKSAYYGGRMEALKIGTFRYVFMYDINSSYPAAINELREIKNIYLKTDSFFIKDLKQIYKFMGVVDTNLYYISMEIFDIEMIGLLPIRHKSGMLFFPKKVKGWYYGIEVNQIIEYAKKYFIDVIILKEIVFELGDKIFNNEINTIYKQRVKLKQNDDIQHYIYKIMLNSIYGKFAQRVGSAKHQNFYYAGYITAKTRALLLKAVIKNPYDVIFFATDGILIKKKLKVKQSLQLGFWEEKNIKIAKVILSGVYKLVDFNKKEYIGERGFRFDFDKSFNDIITIGKSEIETNLFITFKYGTKNHIKYGNKILHFVKLVKTITPTSNIKRYFSNFNLTKQIDSTIIDMSELKKLKDLRIDFSQDKDIYE